MSVIYNHKEVNNLFLRQSYLDSWQEYLHWLEKDEGWDYIILTASNEAQAEGYRREIEDRRQQGHLPPSCRYVVLADPDGKRVGSGGATLNVLKYLALTYGDGTASIFRKNRILVIHSGGDSKRVPQYSVCGKLFSPVPRLLPDGRPSTLFDEFMISMSAVAGRVESGMLVLSGDVLLLFNPLQLDFQYRGAAAISIKADVAVGRDHGVFLNNGKNYVGRFLHKQSEEQLREMGAVNDNGKVDLDTGAVLLDADLLAALFSLIAVDQERQGRLEKVFDEEKFRFFVNEKSRISFYGDFLYPLAAESTLEEYYREAPEGTMCEELLQCRTAVWEAISGFSMKLISLSPAEFIHFGTTRELLKLVTRDIDDYRFLGWSNVVHSNRKEVRDYAVYNSLIDEKALVGCGCYIENSQLGAGVVVGPGSIVSELTLTEEQVPAGVVLHGLKLPERQFAVRIYGIQDNPKDLLEKNARWLGASVGEVLERYGIAAESIWGDQEHYMWFARLYPVCGSVGAAVEAALEVERIFQGTADADSVERWLAAPRSSLYDSFNQSRAEEALRFQQKLTGMISVAQFLDILKVKGHYQDAHRIFDHKPMTDEQFLEIFQTAEGADFGLKIRIYDSLSRYLKKKRRQVGDLTAKLLEEKCFGTIQDTICDTGRSARGAYRIQKEQCEVQLPVRVNWGGGWTDTPPYCNENGGIVLNAAIKLNGIYPVQVCVRRLERYHVEFASEDIGVDGTFEELEAILDCRNPFDHFALHKAALLACGILGEGDASLEEVLRRLGGGIYLSTKVVGIPKGSGLGTSSILAGACVKAIYEFLGEELSENDLYGTVLRMEQIMSTGGGWQDQVGGLCPGIKLITTEPGIEQNIRVERVKMPAEGLRELQERFAVIYTGQRRLARNLLRDVVGNYIGGRPESVHALEEMQRVAILMKYELEKGNIDRFAQLLNDHWKLSLQLDEGASNTCIDQIFLACADLIDGRFIAGAGGGGFLQVILKKGVTKERLNKRLYEVFQDSGVSVWDCEFV